MEDVAALRALQVQMMSSSGASVDDALKQRFGDGADPCAWRGVAAARSPSSGDHLRAPLAPDPAAAGEWRSRFEEGQKRIEDKLDTIIRGAARGTGAAGRTRWWARVMPM